MYKVLQICGKDYKLEYTVEAALYDDCTTSMLDFLGKTVGMTEIDKMTRGLDDNQKVEVAKSAIRNGISGIVNMPTITLTVFYAGLLEHHGSGPNGDGTIQSKDDAKRLIASYFKEHAEDGKDNFLDLFRLCMEQMGEDDFFRRTGLEEIMKQFNQTEKPNRAARRRHKKASGKRS